MLPIVQRELRVSARDPKLYFWRLWIGALLVSGTMMAVALGTPGPSGWLFRLLSGLALLFCLLEGLRKTADAISREKQEGTLGLLFLTSLTGADIILGKLSAGLVRSLNALLAFLPILAVSFLMGGTTGREFWRMALLLTASLAASLCLCLACSAVARRDGLLLSVGALFFLCFGLPLAGKLAELLASPHWGNWLASPSPISLYVSALDAYYSRSPSLYWIGLTGLALGAIASLVLASFAAARTWRDGQVDRAAPPPIRLAGRVPTPLALRRELLDEAPAAWLFFNPRLHSWVRLAAVALSATAFLALMAAFWYDSMYPGEDALAAAAPITLSLLGAILFLLLAPIAAHQSSLAFFRVQSGQFLELLLSTPLRPTELAQGQWRAYWRLLAPGLWVAAVTYPLVLAWQAYAGTWPEALFTLKWALESGLMFVLLSHAGMWMGLTSKTQGRAFFKTLVLGFLAPLLICTPTLLNQVLLILFARSRLERAFRQIFAQQTATPLVPVPPSTGALPPVIR